MAISGIIVYTTFSEDNCTNIGLPTTSSPTFPSDIMLDYKPIIYLYPEEEINLSVKLGKVNNIETRRNLYALYLEGIHSEECNLKEGFVVNSNQTIQFLEEKLEVLGLNEIEAEEFIVYWLPILQENGYNYIRFATLDEINNNMPLELSVEPDTLIRILMQYKPLDEYKE